MAIPMKETPGEQEQPTAAQETQEPSEETQGQPVDQAEGEAPTQEDPALENEMGVKGGAKLSPEEASSVKQAIDYISKVLYQPKVRDSVVQMVKAPPHVDGMVDATMMLVNNAKDNGVSIPDHLIVGVATKILSLVIDMATSLKMAPQDEAMVHVAYEKMLRAVGDDYGVDPSVMADRRPVPVGQGLLE